MQVSFETTSDDTKEDGEFHVMYITEKGGYRLEI